MDVNGTRFHLLLGEDDWNEVVTSSTPPGTAEWDAAHCELTLRGRAFQFAGQPAAVPPTPADRRGVAADPYGNRYWIDPAATGILVSSSGTGRTSSFWAAGEPLPLAGLAVTDDGFLVAGVTDPGGLLVFDLRSPSPPQRVEWPRNVPFEPFDMTGRTGGGVFVLDRRQARYWELDRHLRVIARPPAPEEPSAVGFEALPDLSRPPGAEPAARPCLRGHFTDAAAVPVNGDPVAIEAAPDGTVLVLLRAAVASGLLRYRDGSPTGPAVPLSGHGVRVRGHDMALVPAAEPRGTALGRLFVADVSDNQAYVFRIDAPGDVMTATLQREFLPMRSFGGKGLVSDGKLTYYDFGDGWVPLVPQHRPLYDEEAAVVTPPFDSREPECTWHRVMIDGCLPPDTEVHVWSRAADEEADLPLSPWMAEPPPVRRGDGSELPFLPHPDGESYGTWELLLQAARGRHLQLRLRLAGDGRTSPRLRALRVYYPRFSYLERYLPKVYRSDPEPASFLDRYLANVEGLATGLEDRVAAAQVLFDSRTAPADALDWLAGWFDFALDPAWDEQRSRLFVDNAMEFFRWRGTIRGLELALLLALDRCSDASIFGDPDLEGPGRPRVVEAFRSRRVPAVVAGDPTAVGPRVVVPSDRWQPSQGADSLSARWSGYAGLRPGTPYPVADPGGELSALWRAFSLEVLGFEPSGGPGGEPWQRFLSRRYRRVEALDDAYALAGAARHQDFSSVSYPEALPPDGPPLLDWYLFESVVLPTRLAAHRFVVLLPVPPGGADVLGGLSSDERRAIAERVIEIQKPAQTRFEIRFYWSAFRLGEARLGKDTLVDLGSRSPNLMRAVVLGRDHTGESHLGGLPAPVAAREPNLGRDRAIQ